MQDETQPNPLDPTDPLRGQKLELEFPCPWTYTVIGEDEPALQSAVASIVGAHEHTLTYSHTSKAGRYRSYQLVVTIPSDEERLRIFRELHGHDDVRYVF